MHTKGYIKWFSLGLMTVLILPALSMAQDGENVVDGSVGTLVAAAFETVGYRAQQIIYDELGEMIRKLGAVLITATAILALATVAMQGQYRDALWFFIGPAIFLFLMNDRIEAAGTNFQFGEYVPDASVEDVVGPGGKSKVSWVFHEYNVLLSSVYQNLIKLIVADEIRQKSMFLAREQILDEIHQAYLRDPGVLGLAASATAYCATPMTAARQIAQGNRDPEYKKSPEYRSATATYCRTFFQRNVSVRAQTAEEYIRDLVTIRIPATIDEVDAREDLAIHKPCLRKIYARIDEVGGANQLTSKPFTCEELWCLIGVGIHLDALHAVDVVEQEHVDPAIPAAERPRILKEIREDILKKLAPRTLLDEEGKPIRVNPIPPPQCNRGDDRVEEVPPPEPHVMIAQIVAGKLLRMAVLQKDNRSQMLSQLAGQSGVSAEPYYWSKNPTLEQREEQLRRRTQHNDGVAQKYEVFTLAMTLPYIQGIFLYALAISFPFWTLILLVPGKSSAFWTYFALQAWVRSWDVGWAMVMVLSEPMWELFPHSSMYNEEQDPNHTPITIFDHAFEADPSYSLTMYYTLVGVLLNAVIFISAQAVMGSKKAIAGTMIDGMKALGSKFGGSAADWTAQQQVAHLEYRKAVNHINSVKNAMRHSAHSQFSKTQREINSLRADGQHKKDTAWYGGFWGGAGGAAVGGATAYGMVAAGIASGPVGWVVVGGFLAAGALGGYVNRKGTGTQMKRSANRSQKWLKQANMNYHFAKVTQQRQHALDDFLRAGVSNRNEWWKTNDLPVELLGNADQLSEQLKIERMRLNQTEKWGYVGNALALAPWG